MKAEEVRERVLRGEPVRFAGEEAEAERQVEAAWVLKAVEAGKRVELENAVVVGRLDLPYRHFQEEFILRGGEVRQPADFSYARFERGLHLERMEFKELVDLEGTKFQARVSLAGSKFSGGVNFMDARAEGTFLAGGTILGGPEGGAVWFDRAVFTKGANFRRAVFQRPAGFLGVKVGGQAAFSGARFEQGAAFDGAEFAGAMFFLPEGGQRVEFVGPARFHGVKVGGPADFRGVRFEQGAAFDMAEIAGGLFFRPEGEQRVEFAGPAGFHGVKVGGPAAFSGVRFEQEAAFDRAEIAGGLFFLPEGGQRVEFAGPARFHGVKVGGQAVFSGVRFEQEAVFEGASFSGHFLFDEADCGKEASFISAQFRLGARFFGARFGGRVDFDHARFEQEAYLAGARFEGGASFREAGFTTVSFVSGQTTAQFSPESRVDLAGCTYSRIEISDWRELMRRLAPYAPQPWGQLERALRAAGEEERARKVYYEWRKTEGERIGRQEWGRWLVDRFERYVAGYGVRSVRVLGWILVFVLAGMLVFQRPGAVQWAKEYARQSQAGQNATGGTPVPPTGSEVVRLRWYDEAFGFSLRTFLPVPIAVGRYWEPGPGLYSALATLLGLAGWVLVPTAVASVTGLLRRAPPS